MSGKNSVSTALEDFLAYVASQISAGNNLKNAVNDLLVRKDTPAFGDAGIEEWDVLDQSYINIKLQNALKEIENKAEAFRDYVTNFRNGEKSRKSSSSKTSIEEELSHILSIVTEVYQYHKCAADSYSPLVEYSVYRERYSSKYEMKECSSVPVTWKAVSEVNRALRYGYGLTKEDIASILSWKHGEDLSESARKSLNQRVDSLIQTYKERLANLDTCEIDVPIAFQLYPLVLQNILKDCCSPVEGVAAVGQTIPNKKEELDSLIHREIPKIFLQIGDTVYEAASPGKAFENTKQKMYAVRHLVAKAFKSQKMQTNKEQLDLFSLKVLATACISIANASSRTAVVMAFGKVNLIQVKPCSPKPDDQPAHVALDGGSIFIDVPSQWCLVEDSELLSSLSRDLHSALPIATVDTIYRGSLDLKAETEKRAQSLPVVRIQRCSGMIDNKVVDKKDPSSKGIRKRLSRATQKLFNRKSLLGMPQKTTSKQADGHDCIDASAGIVNLAANIPDADDNIAPNVCTDTGAPVPPPRPRRKARKKRKSESARKQQREIEEAKKDPQWFSSCRKLQAPEAVTENKSTTNSLSVASFEELQDVIDVLSGSSTSSLCLSQPMDIDKNTLRKSATGKEAQPNLAIDEKGKISPSDSGIGSTMSVRSHPSISSINGLPGHERISKLINGKSKLPEKKERIVLTPEGKLRLETVDSDDDGDKNEHKVSSLQSKLDFETHCDTSVEDAEVERYIRKSSSCLKLADDRKFRNETGRNGNEVDKNEKEAAIRLENEDSRAGNEDSLKTPTATRTNSQSSDNENETSVQDLINDLKTNLDFQKVQTDSMCSAEGNYDDQRMANEGETSEMDNETAAVSDHHSYDADGSEESEENQLQINNQSVSRSSNTIHGSTESLYYSAWALNDPQSESELNVKDDESIYEQTDSFFSSGLKDSAFNETGGGDAEEFQDCDQPPEMLYQHFNSRFSLPAGFGDRFAKIWGEKEAEEVEIPFSTSKGGLWSSGANSSSEKRLEELYHREGTQYKHKPSIPFNSLHANAAMEWQQRIPQDAFNKVQNNQEQWSGMPSPASKRLPEDPHHPDWNLKSVHLSGLDRRTALHPNHARTRVPNVPHATQPKIMASNWASPGHTNRSSGPSMQQGHTFARPSSVPAQISRPFVPQQNLAHNQASLEYETLAAARHAQSASFNIPPASNSAGIVHYQNWSRESGSEPILGSTNKRQMNEYEAMVLQQQQNQARNLSRRMPQANNQQHWPN